MSGDIKFIKQRPTVLCAQELGSGLGHITRLATIAEHLVHDVHPVFVVRDSDVGRAYLAKRFGCDVTCLVAPVINKPASNARRPEQTMADILAVQGFSDPDALAVVDAEWSDILGKVRPALVISDFAPSLRIAIAGQIPHIAVGNGFVMPPDLSPLPLLLRDGDLSNSLDAETAVLKAANRVRIDNKRAPFARLASLMHGDQSFGLSLPIFDPYRADRKIPLKDPLGVYSINVGLPIATRQGPHIFCYLDADSVVINPVLTALNGLDRPSHIFVRNIDPNELAQHCAPQVGIYRDPADLRALLPQVRLVIHSGTLGTAETALLAGTPQLVFPDTLERELTSQALSNEGIGIAVEASTTIDPSALRRLMIQMLDDAMLHTRAVACAHQSKPSTEPSLPAIVAMARNMLGDVPS